MTFAAAIGRVNAVTLATFANADVSRSGRVSCSGVFDHRANSDDVLNDFVAVGTFTDRVPILTLADADAEDLAHGEILTVDGDEYAVRDYRADGHGHTVVTLKRL